jgi:hypothetical protein
MHLGNPCQIYARTIVNAVSGYTIHDRGHNGGLQLKKHSQMRMLRETQPA